MSGVFKLQKYFQVSFFPKDLQLVLTALLLSLLSIALNLRFKEALYFVLLSALKYASMLILVFFLDKNFCFIN